MATLSDGDWLRVHEAWCAGEETVAAIAARFEITTGAIRYRSAREQWPARRRFRAEAPVSATAASVASAASVAAAAGAARGELVRRFYGLIDLKLGQMEVDMARREDRTPADNERDARALGTLIRNFEKVFGLERGDVLDDDARARTSRGPRDEAAEAEAIRRELAERLVRLRKGDARGRSGADGDPG